MTQETRKDFQPWKVATVYNVQEGICKCGKPLGDKFHRHHIDGNHSNNEIANLELMCAQCHGGEGYSTYIKQKEAVLGEVSHLIEKEASGSVKQVELEAIKLKLRLIEQCYPPGLEDLPPEIRTRNYLVGSGILIKEYEKGVSKGVGMGVNIQLEKLLPILMRNIQLEGALKKFMTVSKGVDKDKQQRKE